MTRTKRETDRYHRGFAREHGMKISDVAKLVRLGNRAARFGEYVCNGEPDHPDNVTPGDKGWNAALRQGELTDLTKKIEYFVKPFGFSGVDYNGLYPTLVKEGRDVRIPY